MRLIGYIAYNIEVILQLASAQKDVYAHVNHACLSECVTPVVVHSSRNNNAETQATKHKLLFITL